MAKQILLVTQPSLAALQVAANAELLRLAEAGHRVVNLQLVEVASGLVLMVTYESTSEGDTSPR